MKASEFIMAKALEHDDFQLTKIAQELYNTDRDIEYVMTKEAGPIMSGLMAAGKTLLQSNTIRNAAIGAGTGAIAGAVSAQPGNRLAGAVKGGLTGGAVGGLATAGSNINKTVNLGLGHTIGDAVKNEVGNVAGAAKNFIGQVKPLFKPQV